MPNGEKRRNETSKVVIQLLGDCNLGFGEFTIQNTPIPRTQARLTFG